MIGLLIFLGAVAGIAGALWLVMRLARVKRARANVDLVGVAGGEAEARLWVERLRAAGITAHVRQVGDRLTGDLATPGGAGAWGYRYEVWVNPGKTARARKILGL